MNDAALVSLVYHGEWERVRDELPVHLDAVDESGRTLLEAAACISDTELMVQAVNELIDLGIDVSWASRGRDGALSCLLAAGPDEDLEDVVATLVRLLEKGADTGVPFGPDGRTPSMELAYVDIPEDMLGPVYDLWFARDDLRLRHTSAEGGNALQLAKSLDRDEFVRRAEAWLAEHPEEGA